jgi:hypothetical protein
LPRKAVAARGTFPPYSRNLAHFLHIYNKLKIFLGYADIENVD